MPRWVVALHGCHVHAILGCVFLMQSGLSNSALAVETVVFRHTQESVASNGGPRLASGADASDLRTVVGEILVEGQDGGLMLQADDGRLWTIQPEQIVSRKADDQPLEPVDTEEAVRRVLEELPTGFGVYRTTNYAIVHNTSEAYARNVGMLFEQLYKGFYAYWKNQKWDLPEPRFPLVSLVFANHDDFLKYSVAEVGETGKSVIGYYHLSTNRMTTFNVPNLERNIATIIHEATHQLAYNVDVQRRFADNPKWVSEGLAMFFESPDLSNPRGWRSIGRVNQVNLARWKNYVPNRPVESLATLAGDDARFNNAGTAMDAYGESWAFTYFLIKTNRDSYVKYMKLLSEGRPLAEKTKRERIEMLEQAFGETLANLDRQFVAYMLRVR